MYHSILFLIVRITEERSLRVNPTTKEHVAVMTNTDAEQPASPNNDVGLSVNESQALRHTTKTII